MKHGKHRVHFWGPVLFSVIIPQAKTFIFVDDKKLLYNKRITI